MQENLVPYRSWAEVSEMGAVHTLHSFYGTAEFKERSNGDVILTVTVGSFIFRIAVEEAVYDQQGAPCSETVSQPIEIITLTREGYAFWNTRWIILGSTPMNAHMVFDS